jgi:hypothetical protein
VLELAAATGEARGLAGVVAARFGLLGHSEGLSKVEMASEDMTYQALVTETVARRMRGGSFLDPQVDLRAANRNWVRPSCRNYNVGIRVARTLVVGTKLSELEQTPCCMSGSCAASASRRGSSAGLQETHQRTSAIKGSGK